MDGSRCGRIPPGGWRAGGRRISRGHFSSDLDHCGAWAFSMVGSRTSGLGRRWWRGELGASGASGGAAFRKRVAPADGWWWWGRSAIVGRSRPPSSEGRLSGAGRRRVAPWGAGIAGIERWTPTRSKLGYLRDLNSDVSGIERYLRCGAEPVFCWKEDPSGRASSFGWWDPPGRIDPMIGGAGEIRRGWALPRLLSKCYILLEGLSDGMRPIPSGSGCMRGMRAIN